MFKQAHISLSRFFVDEMEIQEAKQHRLSLSFGSILPDVSLQLRRKDHEFTATWEETKERIRAIESAEITDTQDERDVCRQIGIVLHYLADYFTCPHNPSYGMRLPMHALYEGRQVYQLHRYLSSSKAKKRFRDAESHAARIHSEEELFSYVAWLHGRYLKESRHTPRNDCRWVVSVCGCAAALLLPKVSEVTKNAERWCDSAA